MDHPGPTLVSHPRLYLSARPISHSFWCSTSCDDPDSTVQESYPHKWGQDVNCGHLMQRWQLILELFFHYSFMAVSLHLCFPLGRSRRLPSVACHPLLTWSRVAENRIVLGNVSWQFGPFRSSSDISSSSAWALGLIWDEPRLPDSLAPHFTLTTIYISVCGMWRVRDRVQVSNREFHTHIHLD